MFRSSAPAAEVVEIAQPDPAGNHDEPIALSVLGLDLPVPAGGWIPWLAARGISACFDGIGRRAVSREDARKLLEQQRLNEIRLQDQAARLEQQAIADDQRRRAQIWKGLPADNLPVGVTAGEAMVAAARDDHQPKRVTPFQEALAGESLTYHPWPNEADES
jgi:hypothetical protein